MGPSRCLNFAVGKVRPACVENVQGCVDHGILRLLYLILRYLVGLALNRLKFDTKLYV